jgi:hypothetical protein
MFARLFIIIAGPPTLAVAFFYVLVSSIAFAFRDAFLAVGIEFACMRRDWEARTLKPGDE